MRLLKLIEVERSIKNKYITPIMMKFVISRPIGVAKSAKNQFKAKKK